jgi:hypothetical protein
MGNPLFATVITGLGFVCLSLSIVTVFLPYWGYFEDANRGFGSDRGHFNPWVVCKELTYDRTKCGAFGNSSRFKPSNFVLASGIMNVVAALALGIFCTIQVLALTSKKAFAGSLVKARITLAIIAGKQLHCNFTLKILSQTSFLLIFLAVSTLASACLFAIQTDDFRRGFSVTKGASFYLVIVTIVLSIALSILSILEMKSAQEKEEYQRGTVQLKQTRC